MLRQSRSFLKLVQAIYLFLLQEFIDTSKVFFYKSTTKLIYFSRKSIQKTVVPRQPAQDDERSTEYGYGGIE